MCQEILFPLYVHVFGLNVIEAVSNYIFNFMIIESKRKILFKILLFENLTSLFREIMDFLLMLKSSVIIKF